MRKVILAKALTKNKNCWGYIFPTEDGLYDYQNDNDLGLDVESLDEPLQYTQKVYIVGRYYAYLISAEEGVGQEEGTPLETIKALLHKCHEHVTPLTTREEQLCKAYWARFL